MILLAVVDDLSPHSVSVLVGEVDPVIRQREVSRKVSAFVVENFLFRLESGSVAIRVFESA